MEKSNAINSIVSLFLIVVGSAFCFYVIITNQYTKEDWIFLLIGIVLMLYGILRMYLTNRISKDI